MPAGTRTGIWVRTLLDEDTDVKPESALLESVLRLFSWDAATDALMKAMRLP